MDAEHPTQFASIATAYEVNSPLWSDSADKQRALRLPEGGKILVEDWGKWEFPVGTVLLKSFSFDGKLVETRLFLRANTETWVGYSYQWDEAQTHATIVPDERRTVSFATGQRSVEWTYPSRIDCMKCHNANGGSSLGLETAQLNREVRGKNQLDAFAAAGLFYNAPVKPNLAALVTPYESQAGDPPASASLDDRARSYLQANCAFCHLPGADFPSLDLRLGVALADTHACGTTPAKGDVGVTGATNLTPGKPEESVLWLRMAATPGNGRMPQIGTQRVDEAGVKLIGDWIRSIKSCP
jgi:uncharacterized repeat protein (TIGR03806 family)